MMSVDLKIGSIVEPGALKRLFQSKLTNIGGVDVYDVSADGKSFLILDPITTAVVPPITVITNWKSVLRN